MALENSHTIRRHNDEIRRNRETWSRKPLLASVYRWLYERVAAEAACAPAGPRVELGSGAGRIKSVMPHCVTTDIFANPWIDRVESAYRLSFADESVAVLVLVDLLHHLQYPGQAFTEMARVLMPGGRAVIMEPCMSVLGAIVYGLLHPEPLGLRPKIEWNAPPRWVPHELQYHAAQSMAYRIFVRDGGAALSGEWRMRKAQRLSAVSYVASGGYRGPQLYPARALPFMRILDRVCDCFPVLFATRLLIVLEKQPAATRRPIPRGAGGPQQPMG